MTSMFLQKRAGSLFLILILPFHQRGHTKKCGLKAKYHSLKMKLQVSSLNKHMITRTELSILHPLNKHRIHENYEHTSKNKNYLME